MVALVADNLKERRQHAAKIVRLLKQLYPDASCALIHESPLQLLVATILSAQCTNARVNMVTPALFARFPDAAAFAGADIGELEKAIQSTGFFRNKAHNIKACCSRIQERHGVAVPSVLEELVEAARRRSQDRQRRFGQLFRNARNHGGHARGQAQQAVGPFQTDGPRKG